MIRNCFFLLYLLFDTPAVSQPLVLFDHNPIRAILSVVYHPGAHNKASLRRI